LLFEKPSVCRVGHPQQIERTNNRRLFPTTTVVGTTMAGASSRKRQRPTSKKQEEQQKYYDTLLHMCQKDLNKQAKTTKNFECQKLIRKLKDQGNHDTTDTASTVDATATAASTGTVTTNTTKMNRDEEKLQQLRDLPLEPVIRECLRRLGILTLNPKPNPAAAAAADAPGKTTPSTSTNTKTNLNVDNDEAQTAHTDQVVDDSQNDKKDKKDNELGTAGTEFNKDWIERILQHKRMREILEKWIVKVTEYVSWCVKQEEGTTKKGKKSRKRVEEKQEEPTLQAEQLSNSLFVRLGDHPSDDDESDDEDGDGDVAEMENQKKKNRPGQRARKAKFDAKQLRKEGPVPDSFQNWMPSKKTTRNPKQPDSNPNQSHGAGRSLDASSSKKSATPATNASAHQTGAAVQRPKPAGVAADEKGLHPSWKASKGQQAGIVAFQGKKTTFD
jgi:hypothetical protein